MTIAGVAHRRTSAELLESAVHRHEILSRDGLGERLFTLVFRKLVYPQIWEDPRVDLAALALTAQSRVVTIASGGCNVMSYLIANPARIHAVDLNGAHIALSRLKVAAATHLPDAESYRRLFANACDQRNVDAYERYLRPRLDANSRRYWDSRDAIGRRHIDRFARGFYRFGLLGRFIGLAHLLARAHGVDPSRMASASGLDEQRAIFSTEIAPLFERRLIRWLLASPVSLFGLGIPPAQYRELGAGATSMANVVMTRLESLACGHPINDNYFAWQAFARRYDEAPEASLPPYLEPANFPLIKARADRVSVEQVNLISFLQRQPAASLDRFVLLDAQDWMDDGTLAKLWREITRTAMSGARVIFRTAGEMTMLPGRIDPADLGRWHYNAARSRELAGKDRSAIYGGFHLYELAESR